MVTLMVFEKLSEIMKNGKIARDVPMASYTSFKAGGTASIMVEPGSTEELKKTIEFLNSTDFSYYILGNGTNTLVRDGGYKGIIIHLGEAFSNLSVDGEILTAGAGALLSAAAAKALEHGLSGMEFAGGIPGSIGGAVFMNAGAYDGEMKQVVQEVKILSSNGKKEYVLKGEEMEFGYRNSILIRQGGIVTSVRIKLCKSNKEDIQRKMRDLTVRRNEKQPLRYPSAGSFFKRPPGHFAGKLIEDAGLKGLYLGGARISPMHAGFLINEKNATATEITRLMEIVRGAVFEYSGIVLEPEVRIIGEDIPEKNYEEI